MQTGAEVLITDGLHRFEYGRVISIDGSFERPFATVNLRGKSGKLLFPDGSGGRVGGGVDGSRSIPPVVLVPATYCRQIDIPGLIQDIKAARRAAKEAAKAERAAKKRKR